MFGGLAAPQVGYGPLQGKQFSRRGASCPSRCWLPVPAAMWPSGLDPVRDVSCAGHRPCRP